MHKKPAATPTSQAKNKKQQWTRATTMARRFRWSWLQNHRAYQYFGFIYGSLFDGFVCLQPFPPVNSYHVHLAVAVKPWKKRTSFRATTVSGKLWLTITSWPLVADPWRRRCCGHRWTLPVPWLEWARNFKWQVNMRAARLFGITIVNHY